MTDLDQLDAILSENIRKARRKANISVKKLSERMGAGYTMDMISSWENRRSVPTRYAAERVSEILGIPFQELIPVAEVLSAEWDNIDFEFILENILRIKRLTIYGFGRELGICSGVIYQWKKGKHSPSRKHTRKILDLMGVDSVPELVELLEEKEE